MRKLLFGLLVGGLLGGGLGFVVGIFFYPFIFLADIEATETLPDDGRKRVLATGDFIHANPSDPIHYGKGAVTVYEGNVFLGADFEVGPGPKFHVYLVPLDQVTPDTDVEQTAFIDLGRLRAFKGSQVFPYPEDLALADYGNVVIWCQQFGVLVSPAKLNFEDATAS